MAVDTTAAIHQLVLHMRNKTAAAAMAVWHVRGSSTKRCPAAVKKRIGIAATCRCCMCLPSTNATLLPTPTQVSQAAALLQLLTCGKLQANMWLPLLLLLLLLPPHLCTGP
jgi:hypothetical protein